MPLSGNILPHELEYSEFNSVSTSINNRYRGIGGISINFQNNYLSSTKETLVESNNFRAPTKIPILVIQIRNRNTIPELIRSSRRHVVEGRSIENWISMSQQCRCKNGGEARGRSLGGGARAGREGRCGAGRARARGGRAAPAAVPRAARVRRTCVAPCPPPTPRAPPTRAWSCCDRSECSMWTPATLATVARGGAMLARQLAYWCDLSHLRISVTVSFVLFRRVWLDRT